ncbi:hypothetical protein LOK49_LG02G00772 [Camellia lanceoleosa]|uniref:Uncharacterized protein n=1 Tax=Camellia lanceoleosa TaxID=1840588 RepID=A0ACC0IQW5_9ERIC|nr:hypothetical protein LOK49_LG02G00772 [Camellia lanceoleosa]
MEIKIRSPITQYTVNRTGAAANLMENDNAAEDSEDQVELDDGPQDLPVNVTPSTEPPQYWTDFLAMEERRYNQRVEWEQQRVQWEHQMANQVNSLDSPVGGFELG